MYIKQLPQNSEFYSKIPLIYNEIRHDRVVEEKSDEALIRAWSNGVLSGSAFGKWKYLLKLFNNMSMLLLLKDTHLYFLWIFEKFQINSHHKHVWRSWTMNNLSSKLETMPQWARRSKNSRSKKLVKLNYKLISSLCFHEFFLAKYHFLQCQKWPNINFWTGKKFKTAGNAISRI